MYLVFCDIEGCLTPGKGRAIPLSHIAQLTDLIRALAGSVAFTICTGRSASYVEAVTQMLDLCRNPIPCICEGGGLLYWPHRDLDGSSLLPAVECLSTFPQELFLRQVAKFVPSTAFRIEPGKVSCLSLYPNAPYTVAELFELITHNHPDRDQFHFTYSAAAVDITLKGVSKGSAVQVVLERLAPSEWTTVGIGDSGNDIPLLQAVHLPACPQNAALHIQKMCKYVSAAHSTEGVIDILRHLEVLAQG